MSQASKQKVVCCTVFESWISRIMACSWLVAFPCYTVGSAHQRWDLWLPKHSSLSVLWPIPGPPFPCIWTCSFNVCVLCQVSPHLNMKWLLCHASCCDALCMIPVSLFHSPNHLVNWKYCLVLVTHSPNSSVNWKCCLVISLFHSPSSLVNWKYCLVRYFDILRL